MAKGCVEDHGWDCGETCCYESCGNPRCTHYYCEHLLEGNGCANYGCNCREFQSASPGSCS